MISDQDPDDSDGTGGAKYQVTEMVDGDRHVLAEVEATGIDELDDILIRYEAQKLLDKYRLYSSSGSLVGIYDTREEAEDAMERRSYDLFPYSEHWCIVRGDDRVFGRPVGVASA